MGATHKNGNILSRPPSVLVSEDEIILTVQDAASHLKVTTRTIYALIERGELNAFKVGRLWRIRVKTEKAGAVE